MRNQDLLFVNFHDMVKCYSFCSALLVDDNEGTTLAQVAGRI